MRRHHRHDDSDFQARIAIVADYLPHIYSKEQLLCLDEKQDLAISGQVLAEYRATSYANEGAHDPTATPYFILDKLFNLMDFDDDSHLMDVGCGAGRVLAFFADRAIPGKATGVELDDTLAAKAQQWAQGFSNLEVINSSVLDQHLAGYTHLYLFNPFDSPILARLIQKIEAEADREITVCHMSDNGESYYYLGRAGWTRQHQGEFQRKDDAVIYAYPQHYTIWRYAPL